MEEQRYPEPTVGGLVFNPDGEILLMKSARTKNRYVIPGGHIELGERMEDALRREIKEETGLDVYDVELVSVQQYIFGDALTDKRHFIFIDFACKTDSKEVTVSEEHEEFLWIPLERAFGLDLEPFTGGLLQEYRKAGASSFQKTVLYGFKDEELS